MDPTLEVDVVSKLWCTFWDPQFGLFVDIVNPCKSYGIELKGEFGMIEQARTIEQPKILWEINKI